ncbi:aquaporin-11-like [Amphibalanus amphitrite]|uniref:aquaporin-11-like n=1 Tax=Amphibalanus amphitrite TaxID=1232801 RepID=UPI001C9056F5|nr:aquaporin-11-like [Amphibalanus amphitrite]XP_043227965.1 aquaporin-11-like [Amphibalanus amphitrite]
MSLAVSTAVVLFACLVAHLLRLTVRRSVHSAELRRLLAEAITASELCACAFELGIIAGSYGVGTYAVYLFLLCIYQSYAWGEVYACPYLHVEDWWLGQQAAGTAALRILAEVIGGWATWRYVRALWWLELAAGHRGRWAEACTADLQVSPLHGALVEGVAVLLCRLVARALHERQHRFATAIDAFCATSLVVAGFNYSGGYYNPMLASALKLGCRGHTVAEHVAVYWCAATAGALLSTQLYPLLRPTLTGRAEHKRD